MLMQLKSLCLFDMSQPYSVILLSMKLVKDYAPLSLANTATLDQFSD